MIRTERGAQIAGAFKTRKARRLHIRKVFYACPSWCDSYGFPLGNTSIFRSGFRNCDKALVGAWFSEEKRLKECANAHTPSFKR